MVLDRSGDRSYGASKVVGQDPSCVRDANFGLNEASGAPETHLNRRGMVDLGGLDPETGRLRSF